MTRIKLEMSLPVFFLIIAVFCCTIYCACDSGSGGGDSSGAEDGDDDTLDDDDIDDDNDDDSISDFPFCEIDEDAIEEILGQMSLRRKIAQMYVVGAQVLPWFDIGDARRFIEEIGVGGVGIGPGAGIGFWPEWTVAGTNKLQSWALAGENSIPLFIGCDQEGGIPQALNNITGGTDQPGNMGLGATFDPASTYLSYDIMGQELSALGINNPYSPVVEIAAPYTEVPMYMRSFGEDTAKVSAHAVQSVRGFQKNLVIATAKHFPGQGTATGDDHAGMVVNNEPEEVIREKYLPPFQAAIDAGVDMIMTIHEIYTHLDEGVPATFSYRIMTEILRDELGYEGLILSDDMNMGAIFAEPLEEHPDVTAIAAGVDLVLDAGGDSEPGFGIHPDNLHWAWDLEGQIDTVAESIQNGRIAAQRIDESVRRILRTKMKYCLFESPLKDPAEAALAVHTPDQIKATEKLYEHVVTLVKNDDSLWPLDRDAPMKVHVVSVGRLQTEMYPDAFWGNVSSSSLFWEIQKLFPEATGDHFDIDPNDRVINRLVGHAEDAMPDVLIIGTFNGFHYQGQRDLVDSLLELGIPTIMAATATPYDIMAFPDVEVFFAIYSNRYIPLKIMAETIFGMRQPMGRLPVTLSDMYEAGYSAY
jgi:beta-N-acetylhexosaminidase